MQDTFKFVFSKKAVVYKNAVKVFSYCFMQQDSSYRRIYSPTQAQYNFFVADSFLKLSNRFLDKSCGSPVLFHSGNFYQEVFKKFFSFSRMINLRMKLNSVNLLTFNTISSIQNI